VEEHFKDLLVDFGHVAWWFEIYLQLPLLTELELCSSGTIQDINLAYLE